MATLGELWTSVFPSARPVRPLADAGAQREVTWVRVLRARVPAFDALEPGALAIVPGSVLAVVAPGPAETRALVEALARGRAAAILIVEGEGSEPALQSLAEAALAADLPALRIARSDPAGLERSAIGFLVNRRAELDRQAAVLEARLEEVALRAGDPGEVDELVGVIASFLGRAVVLEDRRGEPIVVHAPADLADGGAAVARYHARPRSVALRVSLPGPPGVAGSGPGTLALLGERAPTELERVASERAARLIALELTRADAVRRARDTGRRAETLPAEGPPWVVLVARQIDPAAPLTLTQREDARRDLRLLASTRRLVLRGNADSVEIRLVAVVDESDALGLGIAARVAGRLGRSVAVSRPFTDPGGRPLAEAEARTTLEAVERLADAPLVARADRLASYRLLGSLQALPDGGRHARALLEPLLAGRPDVRREHLATLAAVLSQPGLAEAAAALGVHRNTVAYRVRRIEAVTGWSLSDPTLRLPLALAVRLVQIDQEEGD